MVIHVCMLDNMMVNKSAKELAHQCSLIKNIAQYVVFLNLGDKALSTLLGWTY